MKIIFISNSIVTVSYTHLDVYKRQNLVCVVQAGKARDGQYTDILVRAHRGSLVLLINELTFSVQYYVRVKSL